MAKCDDQRSPVKADYDDTDWQTQLEQFEPHDASTRGRLYGRAADGKSSGDFKMAGGLVVGLSIAGIVGLQLPFLFTKSAPYMATPGNKIRRALQFLNNQPPCPQYGNKSVHTDVHDAPGIIRTISRPPPKVPTPAERPLTFVDLGSGDGQAVYEAARLGYHAIGIEFNWTLWAFSSIRRMLFWSRDDRTRSTLLRQDFTHYHLREADTVMIFAVPRTMPVLGRKIQAECKPGTTVLAYRFAIPLAQKDAPNDGEGGDDNDLLLKADLIYDQEEMRIYRMKE